MEDGEALLEKDPLAHYIKNLNIPIDVELAINEIQIENERKTSSKKCKEDVLEAFRYNAYEFQLYRQEILASELLFMDDSTVLQAYYTEISKKRPFNMLKKLSMISLTAIGATALFYRTSILKKLISSVCFMPSIWMIHNIISKSYKMTVLKRLLKFLMDFTTLLKKCINFMMEYSMSLYYYTASTKKSSLSNMLEQFIKSFYSYLYEVTSILRYKSFDFVLCVPLSVDLSYLENIEMVTDPKIKDVKILYEYFLLTQSHFLKVLGLTFCPNLWATEQCDFTTIFSLLIPMISTILLDKTQAISAEYNVVKNFGVIDKAVRAPKKYNNLVNANINTCLHTAEVHLHQLICKVQDAQKLLTTCDLISESKIGAQELLAVLKEIEDQIDNPKYYLNSASITVHRLLYNNTLPVINEVEPYETDELPLRPPPEPWQSEPVHGNEVYELFIPKEGLTPIEEDLSEDVMFPTNNYDYSGTLVEELRQILKERNPEIVEEEEKIKNIDNKNNEENEENIDPERPLIEIFRPQQPIGFGLDNMLQNILTSRQQLQEEEEEFCCDILEE